MINGTVKSLQLIQKSFGHEFYVITFNCKGVGEGATSEA